jgi:two-component system, sensor histidine kinase YesM
MKVSKLFLPLRLKFILFFCLLITIPLTIIGILTYRQYMNQVEQDANLYTGQIANQIINSFDHYYREMDRLTTAPYYDPSVMEILRSRGAANARDFVSLEEINKMSMLISSLAAERPEIQNILIFTLDGVLFTNTDNSINKVWEPDAAPWMEEVTAADGAILAIPPHSARYYQSGDRTVISLARVIRDPQTHRHLGIIKIDLTQRGFASIFGMSEFKPDTVIHVSDKKGNKLYSSEEGQNDPKDRKEPVFNGGPLFLTAEQVSSLSGIVVKALVPEEDLKSNARSLIRYTLLVSIAALLSAFLLSGLLAAMLTKPIRHLAAVMKKVQRGEFKERANVTTRDEIGLLTEGFNAMVAELDRLVHQVYEGQLREKEAQLSTLESQINPHFIYNTLESINVKALEWGNIELSEAVVSLGRLLRYTVDKQERLVRLGDELQFAEAYLQIQSFRLGDMLRMQIHSDLSLDSCLMPKLILQPLVENAIEHGMQESPLTIRIRACSLEEDLLIYVEDDGAGLTEHKLMELDKILNEPEKRKISIGSFGTRKKGFALRNVNERIKLLYGQGYGLFFDRSLRQGASFFIRIPLRWEHEE